MEKPVAKITKENHLNQVLGGLPLLTALFGVNILMVRSFMPELSIAQFALSLGLLLIGFVSVIFIYDKYHHILLYEQYILIYFQPLGIAKKIVYTDIVDIVVPPKDLEFSSLLIKMKNEEFVSLHFVDHPLHVKKVLMQLIDLESEAKEAA